MELKEIEHKIACNKLTAAQVFTLMIQHIERANLAEHEADHDRQKAWDYAEGLKALI